MPRAKYRLHANKVDRIAIVDRPAVPNAQIVLFKREKGKEPQIEKALDFNSEFVYQGTEGAVIALENSFWSTLFDDDLAKAERMKLFDRIFKDFSKTIGEIMSITKGFVEKQEDGMSPEEVARGFSDRIRMTAVSDAFMIFRQHLGFFVVNADRIEDSKKVVTQLIDTMKQFVLEQADLVIEKKISIDPPLVIDKEGRVISSSRLRRLKQAMSVIAEIIGEAEKPKEKKEGDVDIQELILKFEELVKKFDDQSVLLAEIQKKMDAEPEFVKGLVDRLDAVEKKIGTIGEDVVIADSLNAQKDQIDAIITQGEKAKETEEEKKAKADEKEELNKRIEKTETIVDQIVKGYDGLAKRMGLSKGLDLDNNKPNQGGENAFDKMVKHGKAE